VKPPKGGFFVPEIWLHQYFAIQHRHKKGRQLATFLNKGIEPRTLSQLTHFRQPSSHNQKLNSNNGDAAGKDQAERRFPAQYAIATLRMVFAALPRQHRWQQQG